MSGLQQQLACGLSRLSQTGHAMAIDQQLCHASLPFDFRLVGISQPVGHGLS
jgi:hypothetical protein